MKKSVSLSLAAAALLAGLAGQAHALDVSTTTGITAGASGSRSDINSNLNNGSYAGAGTVGSSGQMPSMQPPPDNGMNYHNPMMYGEKSPNAALNSNATVDRRPYAAERPVHHKKWHRKHRRPMAAKKVSTTTTVTHTKPVTPTAAPPANNHVNH